MGIKLHCLQLFWWTCWAVVKPGTMEMETETEMELRVHVQRQGLWSLATSLELRPQLPVLRRRLREGPAR